MYNCSTSGTISVNWEAFPDGGSTTDQRVTLRNNGSVGGIRDGENSMKRIAVAILLLASYCQAQTADGFQPASTNVSGAEYARVDASGRAASRTRGEKLEAVELNFWSNRNLDMVRMSEGLWTPAAPPLVPGFHYYN